MLSVIKKARAGTSLWEPIEVKVVSMVPSQRSGGEADHKLEPASKQASQLPFIQPQHSPFPAIAICAESIAGRVSGGPPTGYFVSVVEAKFRLQFFVSFLNIFPLHFLRPTF